MRLSSVPASYNWRIALPKGLATIAEVAEIDDLEENNESPQHESSGISIGEVIYQEFGTYGDLVEISRKAILEGYTCPPEKTPIEFSNLLEPAMVLPSHMPDFVEGFAHSSRNRWMDFHNKKKVNPIISVVKDESSLSYHTD
jgi:hypothetical protein